ncbi:MAG: phosphodiester glycosidase family protein [Muribaculaceae bacterium]|nr:phosphodiester glycosidase family protein [Muribaculaceae bacterium]MBR6746908.1 phosphodiester glycosidase family protein [Muribaculaceae bacterium]
MKHLYRALSVAAILASCSTIASAQNTMYVNGKDYAIDTIIPKHSVGPGCEYAFYRLPDRPMTVHVLEMDLTNPYVDMQVVNGGDAAVATERPSSMYARFDSPGHDMIAAHNGDFFTTTVNQVGISRMGLYCDGEIVFNPVSQPLLVLTPDRVPYIDRVHFMSNVTHKGTTKTLNTLNMLTLEFTTDPNANPNLLSLFTNAFGSKMNMYSTGGKIAVIKAKDGSELKYKSNCTLTCVVESVSDNPGEAAIPANSAILHGVGTSADFIGAMAAGDEVTIQLRSTTNEFPDHLDIDEAIGGSGHIILKDGEITNIGNPECHPRTFMGINKEKTKIYSVIVDGRQSSISAGITLDDQGYVLKALGAWDGINLDGGGSSCMYINEEIKNSPSDGTERYVGNGVIFYSTAPVDDNFATLAFEPRAYKVPITATFRPIIYAYNQYGLLKSKDVTEAVVTCDEHIGTMKDGVFTATQEQATGYLYAEYNGLKTKQLVSTVKSDVNLVSDAYIVDDRRGYPIQMNSSIGNFTYEVNAASVDWASSNAEVANVEEGLVYGYKNGAVTLTGISPNFADTVNITVEIPESNRQAIFPTIVAEDWKLKQSGGKNIAMTPNGTGFDLTYTGANARSNYITATSSTTTYSLPYGVRVDINPGDAPITKMQIAIADKLGNRGNLIITDQDIPKNTLTSYIVPFTSIVDIDNNASYPITISNIRFDMGTSTTGTEYKIQVPVLEQLYGDPSGVEHIINSPTNQIKLYPNPAEAGAPVTIECEGAAKVEIYNIGGALVESVAIEGTTAIETANLNKGIYIVRVITDDATSMGKLIIK